MKSPTGDVPAEWMAGGLARGRDVSLALATKLLDAAEHAASAQGFLMSFAVADAGGNLVAFRRMDDAMLASIQIAMDKAYTSVFGKLPTITWRGVFDSGAIPELHFHQRWTPFSGGFPLIRDGKLCGGLGVSGATALGDAAVCEAALAAACFSTKDAAESVAMFTAAS